jgi:hypothetical protein
MPEDWSSIAAEVQDALASIGDVSQPNGYPATIRRVVPGTPDPSTPWIPSDPVITYTPVIALQSDKELRDINGTLIGMTKRTVTISGAAGIAPTDDDTILLGQALDYVDAETDAGLAWGEIMAVRPLAPAGVAVLYEIDLAS